jgi:two-component system response regulator FlrC
MAKILVVEDDEGVRSFLTEALEDHGHQVAAASDGQQALLELAKVSFELVVTDLKMPGMDGMTLLRRLRIEQPDVEVIVLTAHGTVETAVEAMKLGAHDYLQKPLSGPAELRLVVGRALERRRLLAVEDHACRQQEHEPVLTYGAPSMVPVVEALRRVARTQATVLLQGESGTGKEVAARAIHRFSPRAEGPFVAVNCGALAPSVLESELFGHEKGAFTGAHVLRRGRLELAQRGTFFLDEIGELRPDLQVKLLRVLQERAFERVGGSRTLEADVRWIAATNSELDLMVKDGSFREDLYHRLAVFPITIPPLRERREDVVPLARLLLEQIAAELGRPVPRLTPAAEARLLMGRWPGNVRQLRNVLERSAIVQDGPLIDVDMLPDERAPEITDERPATLSDLERDAIQRALAETGGNRRRAAERLGIGARTLYEKLKRYGLK